MARLFSFALAVAASLLLATPLQAQFPGYPPSGSVPIGQGSAAPPSFILPTGDCTLSALGAIVCTKTAGVPFYTGLPAPVNPNDAATVQYVQSIAVGLIFHQQVALATAAALPANTYNNGAAGVGATLTATGNAALVVDGFAVLAAQRILVNQEAAPANNGIYVVTATGDGSHPYVLTRATDANTAGTSDPTKIGAGSFVLVNSGSTLVDTGWIVSSSVVTIGTSPIIWAQFSGSNATVASNAVAPPQGRLTLQSQTPVMTTSQSNKTTIFYDCFHGGNTVPLFNGASDIRLPIAACEISTALESSGTGVENTANVFDVWAIDVSAAAVLCVATNGSGGGWASDTAGSNTARGTGYSQLDTTTRPYITNKNSIAHCYNGTTDSGSVAVNQATYLGSFYTNAAGQTTYQFGSRSSVAGLFGIWNAYNRVSINNAAGVATSTWLTSFGGFRQTDESPAAQIQYVYGLNEDAVMADAKVAVNPMSTGAECAIGIGIDQTANSNGTEGYVFVSGNDTITTTSAYDGMPGVGFHTISSLERGGSNCLWTGAAQYQHIAAHLRM